MPPQIIRAPKSDEPKESKKDRLLKSSTEIDEKKLIELLSDRDKITKLVLIDKDNANIVVINDKPYAIRPKIEFTDKYFNNLFKVVEFESYDCSEISDDTISRLYGLRKLSCVNCPGITDESTRGHAEYLTHLKCYGCPGVTHETTGRCRNLTSFDMSEDDK